MIILISYDVVPIRVLETERKEAFDMAIDFLKDTYRNHGWRWD